MLCSNLVVGMSLRHLIDVSPPSGTKVSLHSYRLEHGRYEFDSLLQ
jgi:hypothetical protein